MSNALHNLEGSGVFVEIAIDENAIKLCLVLSARKCIEYMYTRWRKMVLQPVRGARWGGPAKSGFFS
jgi:hypothetical protein